MLDTETVCSVGGSSDGSDGSGPPSLQNELDTVAAAAAAAAAQQTTMERSAGTDSVRHINQATSPQADQAPGAVGTGTGSSGTASEPVTPTHAPNAHAHGELISSHVQM